MEHQNGRLNIVEDRTPTIIILAGQLEDRLSVESFCDTSPQSVSSPIVLPTTVTKQKGNIGQDAA